MCRSEDSGWVERETYLMGVSLGGLEREDEEDGGWRMEMEDGNGLKRRGSSSRGPLSL
jgi:hypothetical protein